MSTLDYARQNPVEAAVAMGAVCSFAASVILAGIRKAFPEPADQLPRWLRFLEGALDKIAANSERKKQ